MCRLYNPQVTDIKDYWWYYTVLPVPRSLAKRVKEPFGEKRRSISGIVIDTDQFKQTKTGGWIAYLRCL